MSTRKDRLQPTTRLNLEVLEDRLAAGTLLPYVSLTPPPPHIFRRIVIRMKLLIIVKQPLITAGDALVNVAQFLKPGRFDYSAKDVVDRLLPVTMIFRLRRAPAKRVLHRPSNRARHSGLEREGWDGGEFLGLR